MPIINLQRGIAEAGRIRIGQQVPAGKGKTRPAKLETFRLTSADRRRIEQAAELFGGTVEEWDAPAGNQWQVITKANAIDVIVPPSDLSFSQSYELWSAGGCQRRCDGQTESIGERPCVCDPDNRECDIHTRLSVLIRDLPGFGVWRLDTQGWYAARELNGAVQMIQLAAGHGALLPARLRLEQRAVKRPGKDGKPVTQRFAVPVLDIEVTPAQLLAGRAPIEPLQIVAAQERLAPLTPVPPRPQLSITEQSAPPPPATPRKNAAPAIPASGRRRSRLPDAAMMEAIAPGADDLDEDGMPPMAGEPIEQPPAGGDGDEPEDIPATTGAMQTAAPAAPRPRSNREAAMAKLHAEDTFGLTHDQVRDIAMAVLDKPAEGFSLAECSDDELQQLVAFLDRLSIEDATLRVHAAAMSRQIVPPTERNPWPILDPLAAQALGIATDQLTPAQWLAFAQRIAAGDFDRQQPLDEGRCPKHDVEWKLGKNGKSYYCPAKDDDTERGYCELRPSRAWVGAQRAQVA